MLKNKKMIIMLSIVVVLAIVYISMTRKPADEANLITTGITPSSTSSSGSQNVSIASNEDFLSVLLNVRSILLDDSIFFNPAFATLRDSNIELIHDGSEGRPNPFAPIGFDTVSTPTAPSITNVKGPTN